MPVTDAMNYSSLITTSKSTGSSQELISNGREFQTWQQARVLHLSPVIVLDVLFMLFGVVGNSVVCYICLCRMQRTVINSFVLSLAAVELMGCIFTIPVDITELMNSFAFDFPVLCKTEKYFRKVVIFLTGCILVAIAVERYKRIVKPHGRHVTLFQFRGAIIVSLILSVIMAIPEAVLAGSETVHTQYGVGVICSVYHSDQYRNTIFPKLWGVMVVFVYVFSIATIGITYSVIASKIWKRGKVHTDRRSKPNTPDSTLQRRVKCHHRSQKKASEEDYIINGSAFNGLGYHQSLLRQPKSHDQNQTSDKSTSLCHGTYSLSQCQRQLSGDVTELQLHSADAEQLCKVNTFNNRQPLCCQNNHYEYSSVSSNDKVDVNDDSIKQPVDIIIKNDNDDNDNVIVERLLENVYDNDRKSLELEDCSNNEPDYENITSSDCDNDVQDDMHDDNKNDEYFQIIEDRLQDPVKVTSDVKNDHCIDNREYQNHSSIQHSNEDNLCQLRLDSMDCKRQCHQEHRPTVFFGELIKSLSQRKQDGHRLPRKPHSYSQYDFNGETLHRFHSLTPVGSFRRKSGYSRKRTTFIMFIMTLTTALSLLPHISVMLYSLTRPGVEARLSPDVSVIFRVAWNSFFIGLASHPFVYGFWNGRFKHALSILLTGLRRARHRTDRESYSSARHS